MERVFTKNKHSLDQTLAEKYSAIYKDYKLDTIKFSYEELLKKLLELRIINYFDKKRVFNEQEIFKINELYKNVFLEVDDKKVVDVFGFEKKKSSLFGLKRDRK